MKYFYNTLKSYQLSKKELQKAKMRWCLINCQKAKKQIMNHFLPMALKIATKFSSKYNIDLLELFNEAYIALGEALKYYNFRKSELSTFLYKYVNWHLRNFIQETMTPVRYPYSQRKRMKQQGISMNAVYLSECDADTFIDYRNPLDTLIKSLGL